jgi:hypothetical protein
MATAKPIVDLQTDPQTVGELAGGDTLLLNASVTGGAPLRLPPGTAPTSPVNGDIWATSAGIYARVNGVTIGPLVGNGALGTAAAQNTGTSGANVPLMNGTNTWSGNQVFAQGIRSTATQTLSDDTAVAIAVPTGFTAHLVAIVCPSTPGSSNGTPNGTFWVRPSVPSAQAVSLINTTNILFTTGILSGTTGTDANFNISVATNGNIYLENRMGSTRAVALTFLASV